MTAYQEHDRSDREQILIDLVAARKAERDAAQRNLDAAEQALLEERFSGVRRFAEGDVVLVVRKLFGETRWWPAKVVSVSLWYQEGWQRDGTPYKSRSVSYSVYLKQKDGSFGGSSQSFYASEVQSVPEEQEVTT